MASRPALLGGPLAFALLSTFVAPHHSVVLAPYTPERAEQLIDVLGEDDAHEMLPDGFGRARAGVLVTVGSRSSSPS